MAMVGKGYKALAVITGFKFILFFKRHLNND